MDMMKRARKVEKFIDTALECSVYVAPRDAGLTQGELVEVGLALGFEQGEILDGLQNSRAERSYGGGRIHRWKSGIWGDFVSQHLDPDFRDPKAFDFVCAELQNLVRALGRGGRPDRTRGFGRTRCNHGDKEE